jgi:hypothetical protein
VKINLKRKIGFMHWQTDRIAFLCRNRFIKPQQAAVPTGQHGYFGQ